MLLSVFPLQSIHIKVLADKYQNLECTRKLGGSVVN